MKQVIGLLRGTVKLEEHQEIWEKSAKEKIALLKSILGKRAIDVQHIGSTSIKYIHAKPIIDIVVGVNDFKEIENYIVELKDNDIIFREEDVPGQMLFVCGDFAKNTRTHHIHVVKYKGDRWNNYINFRDYLNENQSRAKDYDKVKLELARDFADNRIKYTDGKSKIVEEILVEAMQWRENL